MFYDIQNWVQNEQLCIWWMIARELVDEFEAAIGKLVIDIY